MDLGFSIKFNFQNRQYYVRNRNILVLYTFSPCIPSVSYTFEFASCAFASYTFRWNTFEMLTLLAINYNEENRLM